MHLVQTQDAKYVPDDTHCFTRTHLKICGKFPQIHLARRIMKKLSSDPPNLGGSEEKIRLINKLCARLEVVWGS